MLTLRDEKNKLRAYYKQLRKQISPTEKASRDQKICAHFLTLASYRYADTILLYYPRPDEVDTRPIIEDALKAGKKVALPRCKEGGQMDFHFISDLSELTEGRFNIPEPNAACQHFDKRTICKSILILVPGLAFDQKGYRLGYGKGYYDRYLSDISIQSIGIAYTACITDRLPRGRYDLPVDLIVTEKGVNLI